MDKGEAVKKWRSTIARFLTLGVGKEETQMPCKFQVAGELNVWSGGKGREKRKLDGDELECFGLFCLPM
ncbi:hypothetical protein L6164_008560 [Bauhinia variegata]|uniref:Uncharacterized protein n=1 Tax=Bauhinia variegata TaxID=167791 RepID=A0ACB9PH25_BAUVA|nr:hypothetical protein L6164_008560 [Bauhinia variegata]